MLDMYEITSKKVDYGVAGPAIQNLTSDFMHVKHREPWCGTRGTYGTVLTSTIELHCDITSYITSN